MMSLYSVSCVVISGPCLISPQAVEVAFNHGVDVLCQTHAAQKAEVAPEVQLIKASVTFGLYVIKSSPELKSKVQNAMTAFLNRRVRTWVTEQGGWVRSIFFYYYYFKVQLENYNIVKET